MKAYANILAEAPDLGRYSTIPQGHIAGSDGTDLTKHLDYSNRARRAAQTRAANAQAAADRAEAERKAAADKAEAERKAAAERQAKYDRDKARADAYGKATTREGEAANGAAFDAVLNSANPTRQDVAKAFSDYLKARYGNLYGAVQGAEKALLRIALDLESVNQNVNPFVNYVDVFVDKNGSGGKLTNDGVDALNNMYSRYVIDPEDLRGTASEGNDSVIFNKSLMDFSRAEAEYVITAYEWLGEHISEVDYYSIMNSRSTPEDAKSALRGIFPETGIKQSEAKGIAKANARFLRDLVIFDGGKPDGDIRPYATIRQMLTDGSRPFSSEYQGGEKPNSDKVANSFANAYGRMDAKGKKEVIRGLWNAIGDDVKAMMRDGGIR